MDEHQSAGGMSIAQVGHHPGLHVAVNVQGKTLGGVTVDAERWLPGVVVGLSGRGTYVTVELETNDLVEIDDPGRVRPMDLADVHPGGVPQEIVELVRAGKQLEAIKRYRALNGATLDEARGIAKL
jgi:hypothetical protein